MTALRVASVALLALLVVAWLGLRSGWSGGTPNLLASGVAALLWLLLAWLVSCVVRLARRAGPGGRIVAEALVLLGLIAILGGGLANWLFRLQGFVLLNELAAVPLAGGTHLRDFEAGPLADRERLEMTLQLEALDLVPADGGFLPESRVRVVRPGEPVEVLRLRPRSSGALGSLRFHQGAFGFAPRIVLLRGGSTILDAVVPLETRQAAPGALGFEGEFRVESEALDVVAALDLSDLNQELKGHAVLGLSISRNGEPLGQGELLPGHFADLAEGYRVGFAGLNRWSEIDVSHRTYPRPILGGLAVALAGGLAWIVAVWRAR